MKKLVGMFVDVGDGETETSHYKWFETPSHDRHMTRVDHAPAWILRRERNVSRVFIKTYKIPENLLLKPVF